MRLLEDDPDMGVGLRNRAVDERLAHHLLIIVIIAQTFVALTLWRAAWFWFLFCLDAHDCDVAIKAGNIGIAMFISLWLIFMTGGLWFGYWMKQGVIQQVHMSLLNIGLIAAVLNNLGLK